MFFLSGSNFCLQSVWPARRIESQDVSHEKLFLVIPFEVEQRNPENIFLSSILSGKACDHLSIHPGHFYKFHDNFHRFRFAFAFAFWGRFAKPWNRETGAFWSFGFGLRFALVEQIRLLGDLRVQDRDLRVFCFGAVFRAGDVFQKVRSGEVWKKTSCFFAEKKTSLPCLFH